MAVLVHRLESDKSNIHVWVQPKPFQFPKGIFNANLVMRHLKSENHLQLHTYIQFLNIVLHTKAITKLTTMIKLKGG